MEWLRSLVRPTVTWGMLVIFGYGLVKGFVPWEAAAPIITMVFVFWFESREREKAKE